MEKYFPKTLRIALLLFSEEMALSFEADSMSAFEYRKHDLGKILRILHYVRKNEPKKRVTLASMVKMFFNSLGCTQRGSTKVNSHFFEIFNISRKKFKTSGVYTSIILKKISFNFFQI